MTCQCGHTPDLGICPAGHCNCAHVDTPCELNAQADAIERDNAKARARKVREIKRGGR